MVIFVKKSCEMTTFEENLISIIQKYTENFNGKSYSEESEEIYFLMEAFGITQDLKKRE